MITGAGYGGKDGAGVGLPDILSQGEGREAGPWPRRLAVGAVLVVVVAVAIVHYLPRSHPRPARAAATASPPLAVSGGSVSGGSVSGGSVSGGSVSGGSVSGASGIAATGQVAPIGGLPAQPSGYQFIRATGGWAVQAAPGTQAVCGSCAGARAVYFLPDHGQSVTQAGRADVVAPGTAGALWLTSYPPGADPRTAAGTAREVSIAGRPLGPQLRLPAGYLIEQGTDRGLLLAPVTQRPGATADTLWDPAAPRSGRTLTGVIAASATQIAWAPPCVARCRLQVLNLATGRQVSAELPEASTLANAAFSPDGRFLAVQVGFSDDSSAGARAVQLELESMTSGRLTVVPHTWVSSDALAGFGWPADSDSLVAELNFTTKVQLASWRPGASWPAIAVLTPQHSPVSLVIGQYAP